MEDDRERFKFLDDSSESEDVRMIALIPDSDPNLCLDNGKILYQFVPTIRGVILNGDIRLLAKHINKNGFNHLERYAFTNLMKKTHFEAALLLIQNLNPYKITPLTDSVKQVGRHLLTQCYSLRTKYIKRHKYEENSQQETARIQKQHEILNDLSAKLTIFCGKMYRKHNKMRDEPKYRCTLS